MQAVLISLFLVTSVFGEYRENAALVVPTNQLSFEVTQELSEYYDLTPLKTKLTDKQRIDELLKLIFGTDKQGFQYAPGVTLPPIQAAREKKGNCLTFAMLFVTLAREVGLDAKFNTIPFNPSWQKVGEVIVEAGHTNVMVKSFNKEYVIEWLDYYKEISKRFIKPMPDYRARSHFYNNLGVVALSESNEIQAKLNIEKAIELDPNNSDAWQNYGVFWMIKGNSSEAEAAFLTSIKKSNKKSSSYLMLSKFYKKEGNHTKADKYLKIGKKHAKQNPFFLYSEALEAQRQGNIHKATRLVGKALRRLPNYPIFYERLALLSLEKGNIEKWRQNLERALELTTDEDLKNDYRSRLSMIQSTRLTQNKQVVKDEATSLLFR